MTISITGQLGVSGQCDGGTVLAPSSSPVTSVGAGLLQRVRETIAGLTSDKLITDFTLVVSQIKYIVLYCTGADLLLETNDSGSPDETVTLKAGKMNKFYLKDSDGDEYGANPFAVDITALYVTNAAADAADLYIDVITDPTL